MGFTLTDDELRIINDSAIEGVANRINSIAGYIEEDNDLSELPMSLKMKLKTYY